MVIADNRDAFWLRATGTAVEAFEIPPGISMITAFDRNDTGSPRIRTYLERFEKAPVPDPDAGDWGAWQRLLAARVSATDNDLEKEAGPGGAMCVVTDVGFGTVSSSLIALPGAARARTEKPVWLFAPGRPGEASWQTVQM
jgi:hypothetical protein